MKIFELIYRPLMKRSMKKILEGRLKERIRPEWGRFQRSDIDRITKKSWERFETIIGEQEPGPLPNWGNRHNVYLAVLTIAVYQALREFGIEKKYAIELVSDAGWKLYSRFISLPRFVARLLAGDPQKQIALMLRTLMIFPFRAPGRPGYEVMAWEEDNRYGTFWTYCPPLKYVRDYVENRGDSGELELFQKTWCKYDWAFASLMMEKTEGAGGHYERFRTMSEGDDLCDMFWYARIPGEKTSGEPDKPVTAPGEQTVGAELSGSAS